MDYTVSRFALIFTFVIGNFVAVCDLSSQERDQKADLHTIHLVEEQLRACVAEWELSLRDHLSVTQFEYESAPDSDRLFEGKGAFVDFVSKEDKFFWTSADWNTNVLADDTPTADAYKTLGGFNQCKQQWMVVDGKEYVIFDVGVLQPGGTLSKGVVRRRQPRWGSCSVVKPLNLPFAYKVCFGGEQACESLAQDRFGKHSYCYSALELGDAVESIWVSKTNHKGFWRGVYKVVVRKGLPVRFQFWYSMPGLRQGDKVDLAKWTCLSDVKTDWMLFGDVNVPSSVVIKLCDDSGLGGFSKLTLSAKVSFFDKDSGDFKAAQSKIRELQAHVRTVSAESRD
jgi:hypothetical protein